MNRFVRLTVKANDLSFNDYSIISTAVSDLVESLSYYPISIMIDFYDEKDD